jgi:hypothetical protein
MTLRGGIIFTGFAVCAVCVFLNILNEEALLDEVNRRLPEPERFGSMFLMRAERMRLISEYKRLYPNGRRMILTYVLLGLGFTSGVMAAWTRYH